MYISESMYPIFCPFTIWYKEVLKNIKLANYEIDIKRILIKEGTTVGLANGTLKADGKKIYSAENLKVGLFK